MTKSLSLLRNSLGQRGVVERVVVISKELVATIVLLFSLQTYSSATVLRIVYNLREVTHRILWPRCWCLVYFDLTSFILRTKQLLDECKVVNVSMLCLLPW